MISSIAIPDSLSIQTPVIGEGSSPVPEDRASRAKWPSSSYIDIESEISSCREAVSCGLAEEIELFNVLMCSNDPTHHSEAMEIALKNNDEAWGRILLFRMYFNGVATDRDVKTALYWLYRGNPDFLYNNGTRIRYTINPEIFLHGDIVLCGSKDEVRSLFCICAQYGVRPDHYICPEQDLYEFFGTPCPDDGQKRCYIKFSTRRDLSVGPGAHLVYCPYDETSVAKNQLLIPRLLQPEMEGVEIPVPVSPSELAAVKNSIMVDVRALNQNGYYVGAANSKALVALHLDQLEAIYKMGKAMYDRMCSKGGRFLITSFNPMGDNFNRLNKFEGMDFSDVTFVVSESAKDLPMLLGADGLVANRSDLKAIRVYLSMNNYEDSRFRMAPRMPLYPGYFFHGDLDTSFLTGVARRTGESSLDLVEPVEDDCKEMVRIRLKTPPMVLLNPYGITIKGRSETENERTYRIISALSEIFLEDGCMVYTNTPFPEQSELPGT